PARACAAPRTGSPCISRTPPSGTAGRSTICSSSASSGRTASAASPAGRRTDGASSRRAADSDSQRLGGLRVALRLDPEDHAVAAWAAGGVDGVDVDTGIGELLEVLRGGAGAVAPLDEERLVLRAQGQAEPLHGPGQPVGIVRHEIDLGGVLAVREGGQRQKVDPRLLDGREDAVTLTRLVGNVNVEII